MSDDTEQETKTVLAEVIEPLETKSKYTGKPKGAYTHNLDNPLIINVIHSLASSGLAKTQIAAHLGVSYRTFKRRCKNHPEINAAVLTGWGNLLEKCYKQMRNLADKGNALALEGLTKRIEAAIENEREEETKDINAQNSGQLGPVTRHELMKALQADPFIEIEAPKQDEEPEPEQETGPDESSTDEDID